MNSKSAHKRENKAVSEHEREVDPVEERAQEIAESERHSQVTAEDRARSAEELLPPNADPSAPELTTKTGGVDPGLWSEPPGSTGQKTPETEQEGEESAVQELFEHGLREPNRSRNQRRAP